MNYELINKTIGLMDFDLIEAADEAPQSAGAARVTPFVKRPWLKWAAAAVAIVVIAGGTPLALKAINSFRNENFVAPNGGNSGIVAPVDSGESESGEPESSSAPDSENNASSEQSGESRSRGSDAPGVSSSNTTDEPVSSSETPADSSSGTADSDGPPGTPEGEFIKDNMPAATYKINGENRSFVYQKSSVVKIDGEAGYRVIDHYADADGATISVNADSGDLIRYDANPEISDDIESVINEKKLIKAAKHIAMSSDIDLIGLESASASVTISNDTYSVSLNVPSGNVEVCVHKAGDLLSIRITKDF